MPPLALLNSCIASWYCFYVLMFILFFIFFYFIDFQIVSSFSQIFALDEMLVKSILEFTKFQISSIDFSLVVENFKFPLIGQIVLLMK